MSEIDVSAIVVAMIAAGPPTLLAYAALRAATRSEAKAIEAAATTKATGEHVDGKMDKLLAATAGQAHAEGVTAGEQAQRDRAAVPSVER